MMDKQQFQDAFSVVRASDTLRLEVANMTHNAKQPTRWATKILIAAAILVMLATTAVAAQEYIQKFTNGGLIMNNDSTPSPSDPLNTDQYELWLDFDAKPDAVRALESCYMITPGENYVQIFGYVDFTTYDAPKYGEYWWRPVEYAADSAEAGYIKFSQSLACNHDSDVPYATLYVPQGQEPVVSEVTIGKIHGYLVEHSWPCAYRQFLWCDGDYLCYLQVPGNFTDAQLESLMDTLTTVEDISPYYRESGEFLEHSLPRE